jgi:MFS family permease
MFYGWYLAIVAFLLLMVSNGAIMYSYSVVAVPLGLEFEASRVTMMLGVTVMTLAGGIMSPLFGSLIDRWSLRSMMLIGVFGMSCGYFLLSFTTASWQVPLIYGALMMLGLNLLGPLTTSTLLARWFSRKRGMVLGLAAIGTSVGGFVFPPVIQWLIDAYEWRDALRILALGCLILTIPAVMLVVNSPKDRGLGADGVALDADAPLVLPEAITFKSLLADRNFWLIALVMSLLFSAYTGVLSNLVPLALNKGLSAEQGAFLISILAVAGIAGKIGFGTIADRVDLRLGYAASIVCVIIALLLFATTSSFSTFMLASGFMGFATGGMLPVWGAILAILFGAANYGRVMGMMSPVIMPLTLVGAPLAGYIFDVTGGYAPAFVLFAGGLVLALIALPFIRMRSDV